jgi:hypothetical protein
VTVVPAVALVASTRAVTVIVWLARIDPATTKAKVSFPPVRVGDIGMTALSPDEYE